MPLHSQDQQVLGVQAPAADEHVFLVGRPPIAEYLAYLESRTLEGKTIGRGPLMEQWRAANDHIRELEQTEAGIADNVPMQPLTGSLADRAAIERRCGTLWTAWQVWLVPIRRSRRWRSTRCSSNRRDAACTP